MKAELDSTVESSWTKMASVELSSPSASRRSDRSHLNLSQGAELAAILDNIRVDACALYSKTKSLHARMTAPDFRAYDLLLENQAEQLAVMAEAITERTPHRSGTQFCLSDLIPAASDDLADVAFSDTVLAELRVDNQILAGLLRSAQKLSLGCADVVTMNLADEWLDQARRRARVLFDVMQRD